MAKYAHYYLIRISFLGFRYHGWQKQAKLPTIQGQVEKTLKFIFGHENFKTLGCGRTDAKVSAENFVLELFINEAQNTTELLRQLNLNFPPDIFAKSVNCTSKSFNIIQNAKMKEYHYYFCFGEKPHPYNTPFLTYFGEQLDLNLMSKAVKKFEGIHDFKRYTAKASNKKDHHCCIEFADIQKNTKFKDTYTPENSYVFKVRAKGFMRYQVRLMMGALIEIGKGEYDLTSFKNSLVNTDLPPIRTIAPSSGLCLHEIEFEKSE